MYTFAELKNKDLKTLQEELQTARKDLLAARLSVKMKQGKKSDLIEKNKVYVAQILTLINVQNKNIPSKKTT